ncbi:MAG: Hsp70 family protein [Phycisphaerales bacterium]|nr:MAG: Hsp70 family protein [Phycisphaerales bacterium]
MARLGIDFGTTNTVATIHDRGIFTTVLHQALTRAGTVTQETFPSAILIDKANRQRWFGLDADRRFAQLGPADGCVFVPSLKRKLRDYAESSAAADFEIADHLTAYLQALAESIRRSLSLAGDEPLETVITWPANANGARRHITRKCFREAGFEVIDTLNEPTASAIELADCLTAGQDRRKTTFQSAVAVFDLGGGTFDASVVCIDGRHFRVLTSAGIQNLGGDDFDDLLLEMFLEKLGIASDSVGTLTRCALLRQARLQKETISTGLVESLFINPPDFGLRGQPTSISVEAFNERARPMLAPAIDLLRKTIRSASGIQKRIKDDPSLLVYLVGGSSKLPLVAELVSEALPRSRVVLTDKPFRSVAMGAAICAMDQVSYRDVFARHFGLIRLQDHGQMETFDTIFPCGTPIPRKSEPPLEKVTWYHPVHSIGHLRYLECTDVGPDGMPAEGVRNWSDILFPYDPALPLSGSFSQSDIISTDRFAADTVCEIYRCDSDGVITVELRRPAADDSRCYEIYED